MTSHGMLFPNIETYALFGAGGRDCYYQLKERVKGSVLVLHNQSTRTLPIYDPEGKLLVHLGPADIFQATGFKGLVNLAKAPEYDPSKKTKKPTRRGRRHRMRMEIPDYLEAL